jgi:hypothetical protein
MDTVKWQAEGSGINYLDIPNLLFGVNINNDETDYIHKGVNDFICDKNFVIATKDIEKTLLLRAKQKYLMDKNNNIEGITFIPNDISLIDFTADLGSLSKRIIGYLEKWQSCEKIWTIALECVILNRFKKNRWNKYR